MTTNSNLFITGVADPGNGDPHSLFFTENELKDLVRTDKLKNAKVWFEHGDQWKKNIGSITYAWVQPGEGLKVVISFNPKELCSSTVFEWVKSGVFRGLSLGYTATVDPISFRAGEKRVHEISVVHVPYHNSCLIDGIFQQCGNRTHYYLDRKTVRK